MPISSLILYTESTDVFPTRKVTLWKKNLRMKSLYNQLDTRESARRLRSHCRTRSVPQPSPNPMCTSFCSGTPTSIPKIPCCSHGVGTLCTIRRCLLQRLLQRVRLPGAGQLVSGALEIVLTTYFQTKPFSSVRSKCFFLLQRLPAPRWQRQWKQPWWRYQFGLVALQLQVCQAV